MAKNQGQGGGGQQNQLFGTAWMQKFCAVEWLEFCDKSDAHVEAADLAARQSIQDVRRELSATGHGIVTAVNTCKMHVDQLEAVGQVDILVGNDLKDLLDKLKKRSIEDRKNREQAHAAQEKKSKAVTTGEATKFNQALTCLIEVERQPMEVWINALSPVDRAQFIKSIAAMSPEQANRAIRDIADCMDDNARTDRARANALTGQQEASILALALLSLGKDDQQAADRIEQHFTGLYQSNSDQHASLIAHLSLFDEQVDLVALLKELAKAIDLNAFLQKCRNRNLTA